VGDDWRRRHGIVARSGTSKFSGGACVQWGEALIGKSVRSRRTDPVQEIGDRSFDQIASPFSSAVSMFSENYVPIACQVGRDCDDKSSAFRWIRMCRLVIPEINAEDVRQKRGVIATPTAPRLSADGAYPLIRLWCAPRVATTFQQSPVGCTRH